MTRKSPIFNFYNPKARLQQCPWFNYLYLHRTARNLAAAVRALHARGYVIGDVNESNILVSETALVTLVDTDSFQVRDPQNGHVYRCPVGKPEFTPPELQGRSFVRINRAPEHDLFGLAVLIFQLLMEGTHPFAGKFQGRGDPPLYEARISAGHFSYSTKKHVPYLPMPSAPPFEILYPALRQLFVRCFEDGHSDPRARPDAQTWQRALDQAESALVSCSANDQHHHSNHLNSCPWCERAKQLGGRDPFPPPPPRPPKPRPQPSPPPPQPLPWGSGLSAPPKSHPQPIPPTQPSPPTGGSPTPVSPTQLSVTNPFPSPGGTQIQLPQSPQPPIPIPPAPSPPQPSRTLLGWLTMGVWVCVVVSILYLLYLLLERPYPNVQQDLLGAAPSRPSTEGRGPPPSKSAPQQSPSPDEKLLARRLNDIIKGIWQRALADQMQIAPEIEKIGLETMLLPETLTSRAGIEQNREKLKRYNGLLERSLKLARSAAKEMEQRIGELVSGQPYEAEFWRGFAKGKRTREDLEVKIYATLKNDITTMTKMNEFMAARLGRVAVQGRQLLFETKEEVDTYSTYANELFRQAQIQADLQKRFQEASQQWLTDMKELERLAR